jgi:hypothetical protein
MNRPAGTSGPPVHDDPLVDDATLDDPDTNEAADDEEEAGGGGWGLLLALLLIAALGAGGWWGVRTAQRRGWLQELERTYSEVSLLPGPLVRPARPEQEIQIYYAVNDRGLDYRSYRLRHEAANNAERVDLIRQALSNPNDPDHFRSPLPENTTIRAAYILDGIVWVDLSKEFQRPEHPSPLGERLTVYALVNTFLLNAPDLRGVRILVEGQPVTTAWGWLDLSGPLGVNLSLIG